MWLKRRSGGGAIGAFNNITTITLVLVSLSLVIKLIATIWLKRYLGGGDTTDYSYQSSETWVLPNRQRVRIGFENTNRYQLDTPQGAQEWARLVPGGDGVVYLGEDEEKRRRPFGVSMFHQMRCLDILRAEIVRPRGGGASRSGGNVSSRGNEMGPEVETGEVETMAQQQQQQQRDGLLTRHCLNYLKQMILCRGDVHLESFNYASHVDPIDQSGDWECRDWEAVYEEARKNREEYYRKWKTEK